MQGFGGKKDKKSSKPGWGLLLEGAIRVLEGSEAVGCFVGYFQALGSGGFTGGTEDPDGANEGRLVGFRGLIHMFHDFEFFSVT